MYFKYRLAEGADPATLEAKKYPMFCDKNDYYIEGAPLHVADMKHFEVLHHDDMHIWSKDSRYAYYDSVRIEVANIKQFKVVQWHYATDGVRVYAAPDKAMQTGVFSFTLDDREAEDTARALASAGIAVRAGLHCAPLAHKSAGTFPGGTVRVSPGAFTTDADMEKLIRAVRALRRRNVF